MNPTSNTEPLKGQKSLLDLNTFQTVTLGKEQSFTKVTSAQEASARLDNSSEQLLRAINEGLKVIEREKMLADSSIPWRVIDEDGKLTDQVFNGVPADSKKVNPIILNMAKGMFADEYEKDKGKAKDLAIDLIRNTPVMLERLKTSAAVTMDSTE